MTGGGMRFWLGRCRNIDGKRESGRFCSVLPAARGKCLRQIDREFESSAERQRRDASADVHTLVGPLSLLQELARARSVESRVETLSAVTPPGSSCTASPRLDSQPTNESCPPRRTRTHIYICCAICHLASSATSTHRYRIAP
jgi:hypothetical protein